MLYQALPGPTPCRSALDVMRLVELLVVLVVEGRKALPKTPQSSVARQLDSFSGDRSHRQVIEAIRAGNNEEFFEAMEGGEPGREVSQGDWEGGEPG